ncbi:MAG: LLM class flavin-dependent oxidoreductase [Actinophytocola sp.]|uniref:LLM class flavin-dependent oxidoreductase n=1 Tax=Actinophytocola sp. TaxID=1872138 RepID=UPI00132188DD|nr:LLM class flavin-dependent oxidoreductase [Actinophytocola sp.]MPZ81827.1 LLM class flavin-dependent oxidoreductase [Actinophytocola sp.]
MRARLTESRPTFGYLLPTFEAADEPGRQLTSLVELGVRAEEVGFDAVWVPDSPLVYGLPDPVVVLAALAAATRRVTLATGMLLGALRQPVLLAHSLATVDRLATGRLVVGLGSGFSAPETERQFAAVGVPFRGRVGRLTETITVLRSLWSSPGKPVSHAGRHITFDGVTLSPTPHTPNGPPIWLAGAGEVAERRVGRLADGWLPYPPTATNYAEGWARVQTAAEAAGRASPPTPGLYVTVALDPSADAARHRLRTTIERWYGRPFDAVSARQATFGGTPADLRDWLAPYLRAGVRHVVLRAADERPRRALETVAAALPLLT